MKNTLPIILLALLAGASAAASADQPRVIIKCSATGGDCQNKDAAPGKPLLPPDQPGDAQMSSMAAPMMISPPSLAAGSMPPTPSAPPALPAPSATSTPAAASVTAPVAASVTAPVTAPAAHALARIPDAAHAACARRKNGSKVTVKLGPKESMAGVCAKEGGKMRFRLRHHRSVS